MKRIKWRHPSFVFFSTVSIVSILITLVSQLFVANRFIKLQQEAICYFDSMTEIDSVMLNPWNIAQLSRSLKLNINQANELRLLCDDIVKESVRRSNLLMEKEKYRSSMEEGALNNLRVLLEDQNDKIRHEYEAMQIWCGILTILFLVFSFYSLFKADDLVSQGKSGLRELNSLRREGKQEIEMLSKEKKTALSGIREESQQTLANFLNEKFLDIENLRKMIEISQSAVNKMVENANEDLSAEVAQCSKQIQVEYDNVKRIADLDQSRMTNIETKISNLDMRISAIQGQLKTIISNITPQS